jgi:hypothetical protein
VRPAGFLVHHDWTQDLPLLVRAMVLADQTLFVAGPPDLVDEEQAFRAMNDPLVDTKLDKLADALDGKAGGLLWAVSTADGQRLSELPLASPPVFDGMAAAAGRLYISTQDGSVVCLGP